MKRIAFILLFLLSVSTVSAFDFIRGNSASLGGCSLISDPSASEMLSVPSSAFDSKSGKVELGINRMHNMKEFDRIYLASAYKLNRFSFALGFSQQGQSDLYTEKIGRIAAAAHIDSVSIGFNMSLMSVGFNEHYPSVSGLAVGFGATYLNKYFATGLTIDNINTPRLENESIKFKPRMNLYGEYNGRETFAVLSRITVQESEKPQFGLGQRVNLNNNASIHWGVSTAPTIYGAGLELIYKMTKISYNASYHPVLGLSQNIFFEYGI